MAVHTVYRIYAELEDYEPKIWRRFEINGSKTMAELGYALITMFEMKGSHLFCFNYDAGAEMTKMLRAKYPEADVDRIMKNDIPIEYQSVRRYELLTGDDFDEQLQRIDASTVKLNDISSATLWSMVFEYDYGDGWQVNLTLESCEKVEIRAGELPRVLAGEGFGIIEDCGGTGGLENIAEAYKAKSGQEYDEYREWLGIDDLDLEKFDINDVNFRLKKLPRIFRDAYEYMLEPTQRSVDLIERKYLQ